MLNWYVVLWKHLLNFLRKFRNKRRIWNVICSSVDEKSSLNENSYERKCRRKQTEYFWKDVCNEEIEHFISRSKVHFKFTSVFKNEWTKLFNWFCKVKYIEIIYDEQKKENVSNSLSMSWTNDWLFIDDFNLMNSLKNDDRKVILWIDVNMILERCFL